MKVAVSAVENNIDSRIAPILTKGNYFIIVDADGSESFEIIFNPYKQQVSGADIFCAQLIIGRGVEAVITGACSDDAVRLFQTAGIRVIEGQKGIVKDAVSRARNMLLKLNDEPEIPNLNHY